MTHPSSPRVWRVRSPRTRTALRALAVCVGAAVVAPVAAHAVSSPRTPVPLKAPKAPVASASTKPTPKPKPKPKPPSKPAPPSNDAGNGAFERKVLELVNVERSKVGAKPLKGNACLAKWAEKWSGVMARTGNFEHQGLGPMGRECGTPFVGENIALGPLTPASVMRMWMNSPGHKANILNRSYTHLGVGWVKAKNGYGYATQDFMGKRGVAAATSSTTPSRGGPVKIV